MRRPLTPFSRNDVILSHNSGCRFRKSFTRFTVCGNSSRYWFSITVVAQSGSRPTIERSFSRVAWPLGPCNAVSTGLLQPAVLRPYRFSFGPCVFIHHGEGSRVFELCSG